MICLIYLKAQVRNLPFKVVPDRLSDSARVGPGEAGFGQHVRRGGRRHVRARRRRAKVKTPYGKRQQMEMIVVRTMSRQRTRTPIAEAPEVVAGLTRALDLGFGRTTFGQRPAVRRNAINRQLMPGPGGRVGIFTNQGEALGFGRRTIPLQGR